MGNAPRDQNRVPVVLGVSSADLETPTPIAVNAATGAVLIDGTSLYADLDTRYLELDCSNDPLTDTLEIKQQNDSAALHIVSYDNDAENYSRIRLRKSDHVSVLSETDDADWLGIIQFEGCNTTPDFTAGARIYGRQNGASGAYVPADLYLDSSTDAGAYTEFKISGVNDNFVFSNIADDTLTITPGSIIDSTGAISFGDENLSTTGTINAATFTTATLTITLNQINSSSGLVHFGDDNLYSSGYAQLDTKLITPLVEALDDNGIEITDNDGNGIKIDDGGNVTVSHDLTISGDDLYMGTNTANYFLMADGTNYNPTSPANVKAALDLEIGTDVQAWDDDLDDIAALTPTDSNFIVGDGTDWVAESGATARTSLGLVAGGGGDIWVEKAGDTMTGALVITPSSDDTSILNVTQADTTSVLNVDTTNTTVEINQTLSLINATGIIEYSSLPDSAIYFNASPFNKTTYINIGNNLSSATHTKKLTLSYGNFAFNLIDDADACSAALAGDGAGNVDNGTHRYKITFVSDDGETAVVGVSYASVTVTDNSTDGKVNLTDIPTLDDKYGVRQRNIYRTKSASLNLYYYLDAISDNTTTTYTDNTADADLEDYSNRTNTTSGRFYIDNYAVSLFSTNDVTLGYSAALNFTGTQTTAVGAYALFGLTSGGYNVAVGSRALYTVSSTNLNVGIGTNAGYSYAGSNATFVGHSSGYSVTGTSGVYIGHDVGYYQGSGTYNVMIGREAGKGPSGGYNVGGNVLIGYRAGYSNTSGIGADNVMIGTQAGLTVTGASNVLIGHDVASTQTAISNQLWIANSNTATPLIYGEFDNAILKINGDLYINSDTKYIKLGANQDAMIYSDTADEISLKGSSGATADIKLLFEAGNEGYIQWQEDENQFHFEGGIEAGSFLNMVGSFFPKAVDDDGMDATDGVEGEIVYNQDDNKFYGCVTTGTPATWAAFH